MTKRNQGEYAGRLSLRVRPEDKYRLEEFAYKARRPNGYILQRALDLYEADIVKQNDNLSATELDQVSKATPSSKSESGS